MKISEKSNGRILEKWLKFPSSHSDQRNRLMNFTPAFFRRFKDLEPMLVESDEKSMIDGEEMSPFLESIVSSLPVSDVKL